LLAKRNESLALVNNRVFGLFENQLQSLREYYGRRYEKAMNDLEEEFNSNTDDMEEKEIEEEQQKLNAALADAAKRASKCFF
jgi:hypothetical protein